MLPFNISLELVTKLYNYDLYAQILYGIYTTTHIIVRIDINYQMCYTILAIVSILL